MSALFGSTLTASYGHKHYWRSRDPEETAGVQVVHFLLLSTLICKVTVNLFYQCLFIVSGVGSWAFPFKVTCEGCG
jgi:hypothetical protein